MARAPSVASEGTSAPLTRYMSRLAFAGATSRKSRATSLPSFARWTMAKPPPPRPEWYGPTTAMVKAVATAASTALPPASSISSPAALPMGCAAATAPPDQGRAAKAEPPTTPTRTKRRII